MVAQSQGSWVMSEYCFRILEAVLELWMSKTCSIWVCEYLSEMISDSPDVWVGVRCVCFAEESEMRGN